MKVEELMIGDLVQLFPNQCRVDGVICLREEHTAEDKWMAIVHLGGNKYERVNVGILEPIPLTEEILVKNGFHRQDNYYTIADLSKVNGFWSIKVIFSNEHPTYVKQIEIENVDGNDVININMSTIGGKIYFVHELQHVLKLQQIEKEIIL